jgi:hypothetical protein
MAMPTSKMGVSKTASRPANQLADNAIGYTHASGLILTLLVLAQLILTLLVLPHRLA